MGAEYKEDCPFQPDHARERNEAMEVIVGGSTETRPVDHIQLTPGRDGRRRAMLMPILREGEEAMPCIDGTVHVAQVR